MLTYKAIAMFLTASMPVVLSCISIYINKLAGDKNPKTWLLGLFNQALWLTWIVVSGTWGFLLLNLASWAIYYRNHVKWNGVKEKPHEVRMMLSDEQINAIALANQFKHKQQPDGSFALNPYVYEFARALIREHEALKQA